jgi:hypothetical protein
MIKRGRRKTSQIENEVKSIKELIAEVKKDTALMLLVV